MLLTSCGSTKTVFLNPSYDNNGDIHKILRVGPDIKGTIYFWDGSKWTESKDEHVYPEGWVLLPAPPKDK